MKFDQIAYYVHNEEQAEEIKRRLGIFHGHWVEDIAEGDVLVRNQRGRSRAHLRFNYDLGIEVELLTYLDGTHWHENKPAFKAGLSFISHFGFHMEDGERPPAGFNLGNLVQEMDTDKHANPYVLEKKRTYHYEIYDALGFPEHKFIWRIQK